MIKKVGIYSLLVVFCMSLASRSAKAQILAYGKAGLNFNTAKVVDLETEEKLSTGINAGLQDFTLAAGIGFRIKNNLYLQCGLDWSVKGYRNQFSDDPWDRNQFWQIYKDFENHKVRTRMHYIGVPITGTYVFNVKDLRIFAQGGLYTSYGLLGTEKISGKYEGEQREETLGEVFLQGGNKTFSEIGFIAKERGDRGVLIGAGIEIDEFHFGLQYQRGTRNIARNDYDLRNRTVSLYALVNLFANKEPK